MIRVGITGFIDGHETARWLASVEISRLRQFGVSWGLQVPFLAPQKTQKTPKSEGPKMERLVTNPNTGLG
jgi:hypothetical protein